MAVLPTPLSAGLDRTPLDGGRVPELSPAASGLRQYANATQDIAKSQENVGKGLGELGLGIAQEQVDKEKFDFATAHANAMTGLVNLDTQYQTDQNYADRAQRFGNDQQKVISDAADQSGLAGDQRTKFTTTMGVYAARNIQQQSAVALKQGNDAAIAHLDSEGDYLMNSGVKSQDPNVQAQAIGAYNSRVDSLVAGKTLTQVQGFVAKQSFVNKYAIASVEAAKDRAVQSGNPEDLLAIENNIRNRSPVIPDRSQSTIGTYTPGQVEQFRGSANAAKPGPVWGDPSDASFSKDHLTQIQTQSGQPVTVNKLAAPAFQGFLNELEGMGYKINDIGGYNDRKIFGTNVKSQHSYGNAIDINPGQNPVTRGSVQTNLPPNVSDIAAKYGLTWGGDWNTKKDAMHFEYTGVQAAGKQSDNTQVAEAGTSAIPGATPVSDTTQTEAQPRQRTMYDYLTTPQAAAMLERVQTAKGSMLVYQQRAQKLQDQQARATSEVEESKVFQDLHSDNPQSTIDTISNNPKLVPEAKIRMMKAAETANENNKAQNTYGKGFFDAYQSVHAPDGDPNKITDPGALYPRVGPHGDLTVAGVDKLTKEIQDRRTPEGEAESEMKKQFLVNARSQITGTNEGLHIKDPRGDELYLKFLAQVLPAYDALKKSGATPADLLNPDGPKYIGKTISSFKRPMSQWTSDMLGAASPEPAKIETPQSLVAAVQAGKMSRADGEKMALERGWIRPNPPPAPLGPQVPNDGVNR